MITNKNIEKYLWISTILFITYLLLGSFIVSKDLLDLGYLVVLYIFLLSNKFLDKKNKHMA